MILIYLAVLAIAGGAAFSFYRHRKASAQPSTFKKRRPLTTAERKLYGRLTKMLPDYIVLPQVPLTRCISVKGPALEKLRAERLDFVVCNEMMQVLLAIELVSETNKTPYREEIELLIDEAFGSAGIHLIRWPSNPVPSEAYIAMELEHSTLLQPLLAA